MLPMDLKAFLDLRLDEVAEIVRKNGPRVLVCPVNGTRRWFHIEHGERASDGFLNLILERYRALMTLFFSHGVSTLLTPILGPDIVRRGGEYQAMVLQALREICAGEEFEAFYYEQDVRVRFYGDYGEYFKEQWPQVLTD